MLTESEKKFLTFEKRTETSASTSNQIILLSSDFIYFNNVI